ncbi:QsdR family transcriptional regulator [Egicoccus halophilus]|uniref:QsdR TetR regulatory C-terminal domain-containing protein n=1 Tax=Egicoccus halophilus TaxID=1670830 RepID=A0A8J3A865_9ACTN|nr:QsdR family transcriptional regulator [Egicoccus halophilus]GGI06236.1 hypothetical protein GCM10011354_18080 [Egicoccus halophilus]
MSGPPAPGDGEAGRGSPSRRRVLTHDEALVAARRRFLRTGDLVMTRLQADLAVGRATLYRVVGSRDQLLGDVLHDLAIRTLRAVVTEVDRCGLTGVERLLAISREFEARVAGFAPLQRFLTSQPGIALPVLVTTAGRVHERMVDAWTDLLREAAQQGELTLPEAPRETAYLYVRVGESLLYADVLAGARPDHTAADRLRRAVLGAG